MEFLSTLIIGIVVCVLASINLSGNISTLHWYHRQHVTHENIKPFSKLVGSGTLIIGISLILHSVATLLSDISNNYVFASGGIVILSIGLIVGAGLSFFAMIKYNGGIF